MKRLKISGRFGSDSVTLVDDIDYCLLICYRWHLSPNGYARTNIKQKKVYLHRLLKGNEGPILDHINGNKLDNRRENIRVANHQLNAANSKVRIDNSSGMRGVYWCEPRKKWVANIMFNGKTKYIGGFLKIKDAAKAYDEYAKILFGEFARTNI